VGGDLDPGGRGSSTSIADVDASAGDHEVRYVAIVPVDSVDRLEA
jgi:hypothetical protein